MFSCNSLDNPQNDFQAVQWLSIMYDGWTSKSNEIPQNCLKTCSEDYQLKINKKTVRVFLKNLLPFKAKNRLLKAWYIISSESATMLNLGYLWCDVTLGQMDLKLMTRWLCLFQAEGGIHGNLVSGHHQRHNDTDTIAGILTKLIHTRIGGWGNKKLSIQQPKWPCYRPVIYDVE